ncbi:MULTISPECIES: ATP synthase F0 subunit B [unclassified Clostridium]|uniref:ATP synthase F0 subunit B n=1 Tax=unclassified Clostridium TaxID=2614128 RepID=UPI0012431A1C
MALEAISKIQQAESTAKDILDKAVENSKQIISDAQAKGNEEYHAIIEDATEKAKKMKEDALNKGNEESQPTLAKGDDEVKNIINTSKEKIDLAINLVIERIVKFNGNS